MNRFEKWCLLISLLLTGGSGVGLLWTKYLVEAADPWAAINHPLQPWFLKIHIVAAPLLVFALGLVTSKHVLPRLRSHRPAGWSGTALSLTAVPLIITGYLIQTVIEPGWLKLLAVAHIVLGILYLLGYGVHQARAALRTAKREEQDGPPPRRVSRMIAAVVTPEVELERRGQGTERATKKLH